MHITAPQCTVYTIPQESVGHIDRCSCGVLIIAFSYFDCLLGCVSKGGGEWEMIIHSFTTA